MKIGFDASRAFIDQATGTENYSLNLLRALAAIDRKNLYRVYVRPLGYWVGRSLGKKSQQPNYLKTQLPPNFEIVKIGPSRLWTQIGLALETWRRPVDVLFVPAHTLPVLRNPQVKTVVTIHDLGVEFLPGYHQFPQRYYLDLASKYAAGAADALIAVSRATKRDLVTRYKVGSKKIFVVPEGVDAAFFRPSSQPKAGSPLAKKLKVQSVKSKYKIDGDYILYVGTVQPRKNLEMLIKAFSQVVWLSGNQAVRKDKNPSGLNTRIPDNLNLVIAGKPGWDYQKILDLPKKLGIESMVKFLGYVDRQDLPSLYTSAAVFAHPSLFEGFGLPILEALACSCPVVASDIAAHREIYRKIIGHRFQVIGKFSKLETIPEAMILVKPNEPDKWTSVLYQYISLYNNRLSFTSKKRNLRLFRQALASTYSWEEAAKQTLRVFQEVLR